MAHWIRWGAGLGLGLMVSAACSNGDDLDPYANDGQLEPVEILPARPYPPRPQALPGDEEPSRGPLGGAGEGDGLPPVDTGGDDVGGDDVGGDDVGGDDIGMGEAPVVDPDVCVTPVGVSGSPRNMSEALILMNSLPKPVSLACFLQALSRPLSLYMTSSDQSLQPSPGARSPRTFIVYEPMVLSIVLDGPARIALELGYRTSASRSVKTEILFPLSTDVTFANVFDEVVSGNLTKCGNCHTGETVTFHPDLPVDVFESDIIAPFEMYEVDLAALRAERSNCDPAAEPERCALLSALFDHGEVRAAPRGIMF